MTDLGIAPYVGVSYSEAEKGFLFPAGINWQAHPQMNLLTMFDGRNVHLLGTTGIGKTDVTLMYLNGRSWGISLGWGF